MVKIELKVGEEISFMDDKESYESIAVIKSIETTINSYGIKYSLIKLAIPNGEKYLRIRHINKPYNFEEKTNG